MKIILAILCGIVVLFTGGCALILLAGSGFSGMPQTFPVVLVPAGIAVLNILVIAALFGMSKPQRWAFYVLAVLDALEVVGLLMFWVGYGSGDSELNLLVAAVAGTFALKGVLTLIYARKV